MVKETNYNEVALKALKFLLQNGQPMTPYQIEKGAGIPHATFAEHQGVMLNDGLLKVVDERVLKSGLRTKTLGITTRGFLLYLKLKYPMASRSSEEFDQGKPIPSFYPKEEIWENVETILDKSPWLSPWLHKQLQICRKVNAPELFRAFLLNMLTILPDRPEDQIEEEGQVIEDPVGRLIYDIEYLIPVLLAYIIYPNKKTNELGPFLAYITEGITNSVIVNFDAGITGMKIIAEQAWAYLRSQKRIVQGMLWWISSWYKKMDAIRSSFNEVEKDLLNLL